MFGKLTNCSFFRRKKGSFVIYALMLFSAMLIMLIILINSAAGLMVDGMCDNFGTLWSKNILGKYDSFLRENYGILAFYGNDYLVEEEIKRYSEYSFQSKKHIKVKEIKSDLSSYNLASVNMMEEAIKEAMKSGQEPEQYGEAIDEDEKAYTDRKVTAEWIVQGLPSYGQTDEIYIMGLVNQLKAGIGVRNLIKQQIIDRYIFKFFKDYTEDRDLPETFFRNEIEYIISGKLSDSEAKKSTGTKIKVLRNMLNLYYLYLCPEKRDGAMALAEILTPGPAATLTQAVILETWAYQEAENDINILYEGGQVPLIKKDKNWALTLDNVFDEEGKEKEMKSDRKYVKPAVMEGENYETYLGVLLCGLPEETKLLRIMDLIQINGKFTYCESFLLADYCRGLKYSINVNGHIREFEDRY